MDAIEENLDTSSLDTDVVVVVVVVVVVDDGVLE